MKRIFATIIVSIAIFTGYSQNTWDGGSTTITTNGNVGIGITPTTSRLQIQNTSLANGITNTGNTTLTGTQYGFYNSFTNAGTSGVKYGIYNNLSLSTASPSYAFYSNLSTTANGTLYGIYSRVTGNATTTGTKYGVYTLIPTGTTGTRYGIYSEAKGTDSWAGFFYGDLEERGNLIVSTNNQSKFILHTSWNSDPISDQWLMIAPNVTSGGTDWNFNNSFQFMNSGTVYKNTTSTEKAFVVKRTDLGQDVFRILGDGKVYATELNVRVIPFPDYVFKPDYELRTLEEVRNFINENGHLPNVPSAEEVCVEGVNVGEMTKILVEKVEELTLYILHQQEIIDEQAKKIEALEAIIK